MAYLLKQATIIDLQSKYHLQQKDILIDKSGIIEEIASSISNKDHTIIEDKDMHISNGFVDLNCHIYQPGLEYREDMDSGLEAAANGGFTTVAIMPNTNPVIDTKGQVTYIKKLAENNIVNVLPIGAVSKNCFGKDLAELYDMQSEGIHLFSDGNKSIENAGLMQRALLYVKKFNGVVMNHPDTLSISNNGQMNEGVLSTKLGLVGMPNIAEDLMIARDICLAEYCESKVHFINVSTENAVVQVRQAKQKGIAVTCAVNAYNLLLDDTILDSYDTNLKLNPPLRSKQDIEALLEGLKDGTIDCICSGHDPKHNDEKKVEFQNAEFGISALETAFAVARKATEQRLSISELIAKFTTFPNLILGRKNSKIEEGVMANFCIFKPNEEIVFEKSKLKSKSKNTPFVGMVLKGEIIGVFNNKKHYKS